MMTGFVAADGRNALSVCSRIDDPRGGATECHAPFMLAVTNAANLKLMLSHSVTSKSSW